MRYALLDQGIVENIIEWDGVAEYAFADRAVLAENIECGIGWAYIEGIFIPPAE